jgi:hypothetical protein
MSARIDGVANYLAAVGLGCHTEREALSGHESKQDHLGICLRNGNEYLESLIAGYRDLPDDRRCAVVDLGRPGEDPPRWPH